MKIRIATWLALLAVAPLGSLSLLAKDATKPAETIPLTIATAHGVRHFRVEVARTSAEQERGLMFRRSLPAHGGMIFPMNPPRSASFWMKNTLIPLDIVFIRPDGTIVRIAARCAPEVLDLIDSGEPVASVLEIGGGRAAALGIHADDHVRWETR